MLRIEIQSFFSQTLYYHTKMEKATKKVSVLHFFYELRHFFLYLYRFFAYFFLSFGSTRQIPTARTAITAIAAGIM